MRTREKKQYNRQLLWQFLRGSKLLFFTSMAASAVSALCDMVSPQIIRVSLDQALGGASAENLPGWTVALAERFGGFAYLGAHIWILAAAILAVAFAKALAQYGFYVANTAASETLVKKMRDMLFSHIERLPYAWHMKHSTGDIIQRCTSDIDTLKNFVSEQLTGILRVVILLVLSIGFMFSMNPKLAWIALAPVPVIISYSVYFYYRIGKDFLACDENEGVLSAMAQENLAGVRVVRAFGKERSERDRFEEQNRYYTSLWMKLAKPMSLYWSTGDILSGTQILLTVVFGALFCVRGMLTPGQYVAFLSYCALMVWPVRSLGRMISEMSKAGVSIDRIADIMEAEEERPSEKGLKPDLTGEICFEHVNFRYEEGKEILHDVSFTVSGGSTVGILGGTGSGKSTLILLLNKLYELPPGNGRITIGGVDIRDIDTAYLRANMALVLQEPFLFSRSIRENIAITRPNASMEEVRGAADAACLDETIADFVSGYETFVGERGVTLSGGQKQRTAIARALLQNTPILALDDSLSAVDTETDARIRSSLEKRFGTASIFLISHRIATLQKADQILVLDRGRIIQQGTHEELLHTDGLYRRICEIQSGPEEAAS
ncbi:MAG: ABC transporter ATP-binding protein [Oscillospiraceae bacterium]|nr:ABC transporter ATP-binding protein [Oscillospiraceae bacterium]